MIALILGICAAVFLLAAAYWAYPRLRAEFARGEGDDAEWRERMLVEDQFELDRENVRLLAARGG